MTLIFRRARQKSVTHIPLRYLRGKSWKPKEMSEDEYTDFLSRRINTDPSPAGGSTAWPDWKAESKYTVDSDSTNEVTELKEASSRKRLLAQDVVSDIRSKKTDSQLLSKNIHKLDTVQLSKLLRKHLIYADKNLIVFSKPYGMVAHTETNSFENASIRSCLPILSKMIYGLNTSVPLLLCNRLDKNTTGITVCATNKDIASDIKSLFREHKVRRKYWGITVGVPSPMEGCVNIPLMERRVDAGFGVKVHSRMTLSPKQKLDTDTGLMVKVNHQRFRLAAETYYRTLDADGGVALVEYQPFTSVKHQLRVHTSAALDCPLLGDHKYSTTHNLLPQRLPRAILKRLNIKSTRSRDQNMHLHLREIIIPGFSGNESKPNLLVSAKLPEHIFKTMKLFRLRPGHQTDFKYPANPHSLSTKSERNSPNMEELYQDPFAQDDGGKSDVVQRDECYAVYKPKVKVKFQTEAKSES